MKRTTVFIGLAALVILLGWMNQPTQAQRYGRTYAVDLEFVTHPVTNTIHAIVLYDDGSVDVLGDEIIVTIPDRP